MSVSLLEHPEVELEMRQAAVDSQETDSAQTIAQAEAPPDMQTGDSIRACLRREVPVDHVAQPTAAATAAKSRND